jgi:hypothetical protein
LRCQILHSDTSPPGRHRFARSRDLTPCSTVAGLIDAPGRRPCRRSTFQTVEWAKPVAPGHQTRSPASLAPTVADPLLQLGSQQPRRAVRTAGAVEQRLRPALAPSQRCHQRWAVAGETLKAAAPPGVRGLPSRRDQSEAAGQSELGVSVQVHPCPPLSCRSGKTHSLKGGPDKEPQPFTTCVGGTASRRWLYVSGPHFASNLARKAGVNCESGLFKPFQ